MEIQISPKSVPKSPRLIDQQVFTRLRTLFTEKNWLVDLEENFIEMWNLCSDGHQQDLVEELIRRFSYITSRDVRLNGEMITDHITTQWEVDPDRALIIAFADSDKPDGSQALLQSIKDKFALKDKWSPKIFVNKLTAGAYKLKSGDTAILIDDFVGTGNTARNRINWLVNTLQKRHVTEYKIFVVALAMMESAKTVLDSLPIEDYFACLWLRRGISDEYKGDQLSVRTQSMIELEQLLGVSFKRHNLAMYHFGFGHSEALFSLEAQNTPNNVFPIFWWPVLNSGKKRNTMFRHFLG
jgi:hypothetical protein